MKRFGLSDLRLKGRVFFLQVFKEGKRFETKNFYIYVLLGKTLRFAIIVGRECGKSTKRNKIKRLVREFVRLNRELIKEGIYIFKAKPYCMVKRYSDIENEFRDFFKKENLFKSN